MHKAYFDILREQLNSDPPEYKQALVLLEDVKQVSISIDNSINYLNFESYFDLLSHIL